MPFCCPSSIEAAQRQSAFLENDLSSQKGCLKGRCCNCLLGTAIAGMFLIQSAAMFALSGLAANLFMPDPSYDNFDKMLLGAVGTSALLGGIAVNRCVVKVIFDFCKGNDPSKEKNYQGRCYCCVFSSAWLSCVTLVGLSSIYAITFLPASVFNRHDLNITTTPDLLENYEIMLLGGLETTGIIAGIAIVMFALIKTNNCIKACKTKGLVTACKNLYKSV